MPALELLGQFIGINTNQFSNEENMILEAELYSRVIHEIWDQYYTQYKDYFHLIEFNIEEEDINMETRLNHYLINDILKSKTYTLSGIAHYTNTPEEVIQDLLIGRVSYVLMFTRKLIELHKSVRPEIYKIIIRKMLDEIEDKNPNLASANTNNIIFEHPEI